MLHTDPVLMPRLASRQGKSADGLVYKTASDHAMVALRIPTKVAGAIAIPGGERAANLHVTLVYLGDAAEISPPILRTLHESLTAIGETTPPLEGRIAGYGRFAPSEDEDVIWAGLDSPDLAELRHRVLQAVLDAGIVPVADHGFTPHITLAYVEPGEGEDSMPPNHDVEIRYLSLAVGSSEIMIPLKGDRPTPTNQPTLPVETFSSLQAPSVEFTRALDLERWAQNQGALMVRADVLGVGAVVVKKGTDVSIGIENWEGPAALDDLVSALGAIKHDVIMVGRVAAWDTATESWVDGADMAAVLLAERVAAPVFFASDVIVLDGDISRLPARERFERLRVLVAPAGGAVVVPLQIECTPKMDLSDCVDEVAEWQPSGREGGWYCPGVTVVGSDSPYAHGTSEHEVRLILRVRKDEGLIGIGSGGGVTQPPGQIIDDRIRKPHFPDIRPIAAVKDWDESKHPRDPGGEDGGQWTSGGGAGGSDPAVAEFLAKLDADPKIQAARKAIAETIETIKVHKKGGEWTPERQALHEQIVAKMLDDDADVPEGKTPTATFVIGLPASGKSGVLKPTIANLDKATVIDPDAVKEHLPEYNGKNAGAVHAESGEIAEGPLLMAALQKRHNLVFDLVGKNKDKLLKLTEQLKKAGYAVDLRHVTLPPIEAAKRALTRFDEMGRFVDPKYILQDVGRKSDETYEALKNSGAVRSWESYDNSGPFGSKPRLREHGGSSVSVSRGTDGGGHSGEVLEGEGILKDGFGGATTGNTPAGILAPQQGMFGKPKRSRNMNKGEIRTDLTLLKVGWTDEAREAAAEARRRKAGVTVKPREYSDRTKEWEIRSGKTSAYVNLSTEIVDDKKVPVLYVGEVMREGEPNLAETLRALRQIQTLARQQGVQAITATVVNDELGQLIKKLPGVRFERGTTASKLQPNRGHYYIPVPREPEAIAASETGFEMMIEKAWTDEARAAALDARRGKTGTPAGEDWQYPNPMGDMADVDPTPNDEPRVRMKPNVWHPRKWADGDSFAVGYGVVGGHTFRPGTLKDGQFVPDPKQPRVNPYEAIFQRKGVLLGLGTVTKSAIDEAEQRRLDRETHDQTQAAIVGALVAMSERGVPESALAVEVAKIGWTDEARAKALETRRRNAAGKKKPTGMLMPLQEADKYKVRMRDASGETLVAPDGTVYSDVADKDGFYADGSNFKASHSTMAKALGDHMDNLLAQGYVRGRMDDGIVNVELDLSNPKARASAKGFVSAHGRDANIYVDHMLLEVGQTINQPPTAVFVNPGAIGKALRFIESAGKDRSETKPGARVAHYSKAATWDESKHPRDPGGEGGGQFTAGGGSEVAPYVSGAPRPTLDGGPEGDHTARGAKLVSREHQATFYQKHPPRFKMDAEGKPTKEVVHEPGGDMNHGPSSFTGAQHLISEEAKKGMQTEAAKRQVHRFNWAWTYGQGDPQADLLLLAAQKEWGGDVYHRGYPGKTAPKVTDSAALAKSSWDEFTSTATKNPNPGHPMEGPGVEQGLADFGEYLKIQYAATQAHLKTASDTLTLYRGMSTDDAKLMKKGGKIKLTLGAMSSTSGDPKKAAQFGNVVMRIQVPKTAILGDWRSGMGAEELDEVVVLGGKQAFDAEIVRVGKPKKLKAFEGEDFVSSGSSASELTPSPLPLRLIDENGWERKTNSGGKKTKVGKGSDDPGAMSYAEWDESKHPRAEDGKWTDGSQATKPPKMPTSITQPSLPGMESALSTWEPENPADKVRQLFLEEERQTAIGHAQRDWDALVGEEITVTGKGGWEGLSDDEKSEIQNQWENDNVEQYIEEATKEWQDSSEAQEKKQERALETFYENVNESDVKEPVTDAIKEAFQGSQRQMDHFLENMDAMRLYQMGEAEDTREIEKHLDEIMGDQELEGDEQVATMDASGFASTIRSDYESRIESMMKDIEVEPDDDAKETINQNAYEAVSEAFHNSDVDLDDLAGGGNKEETYTVEEPKRWLLEQPTGDLTPGRMTTPEDRRQAERDYENTRKAAQALVGKRAEALWRERNPVAEGHEDSDYIPDFHVIGDEFWNDWKRDSNAEGTRGMQNALIHELGVNSLGRQGEAEPSGAQKVYAKALWQTTQFVLHKAGMNEVHAYRAVMLSGDDLGRLQPPVETVIPTTDAATGKPVEGIAPKKFAEFTDLDLKQATAQSFTFDKSVANSWGGVGGVNRIKNPQRVVLRATVPPEAVWSLPVYGKNLQNENEVVILGTPWKKWEAWDKFAPDMAEVPMKRIQVSETPQPEKPKKTPDSTGKD